MQTRKVSHSPQADFSTCTSLAKSLREPCFNSDSASLPSKKPHSPHHVVWQEDVEFLEEIYSYVDSLLEDSSNLRSRINQSCKDIPVQQLMAPAALPIWSQPHCEGGLFKYLKTIDLLKQKSVLRLAFAEMNGDCILLWQEKGKLRVFEADPNAVAMYEARCRFIHQLREKSAQGAREGGDSSGGCLKEMTQEILWLYRWYLELKRQVRELVDCGAPALEKRKLIGKTEGRMKKMAQGIRKLRRHGRKATHIKAPRNLIQSSA